MFNYLSRHLQVFFQTLGDLFRSPSTTLLGAFMIGITIVIPLLAYIALSSAKALTNDWEVQPQINVYLAADNSADADALTTEIGFIEGVKSTRLIPKDEAFTQFKKDSGLATELESLTENPLPDTVIVTPENEFATRKNINVLADSILKIEGIGSHSINFDWLSRFNSLLKFGNSVFWFLAGLLALAVVLVLNNTISLLIHDRKQEIIVTQLVGGTNSFIKRPFLYYGAILGFLGAVVALIIYLAAHFLIKAPVTELANSYGSHFTLATLDYKKISFILLGATILGWLAAQLSLIRQLHKIKPK